MMGSLHSLVERWRVFSEGTNVRDEIDSFYFSFSLSLSLPPSLSLYVILNAREGKTAWSKKIFGSISLKASIELLTTFFLPCLYLSKLT
jgi:hypothetical protein